MKSSARSTAPLPPVPAFAIGVTGHRALHPSYPRDETALDEMLAQICDVAEATLAKATPGDEPRKSPLRLLTLLSDGVDHLAAQQALARGWDLVIPLPFGRHLNSAINSGARDPAMVRSILDGRLADNPAVDARIAAISNLADQGAVFELADRDVRISELLLRAVDDPTDISASHALASEASHSAALAGRVMIEHCDLLIAVWDGQSTANSGGTGHTALRALESGLPVLWIDPRDPSSWRLLSTPEELGSLADAQGEGPPVSKLQELIQQRVGFSSQAQDDASTTAPDQIGPWRAASRVTSHAFRRVETLFGQTSLRLRLRSVRQTYERPDEISQKSAKPLLDAIQGLTPNDDGLRSRISDQILTRFAWMDGISAHLSDRHRSGMVMNFVLGAGAIIFGILYIPLVDPSYKWVFASIELALLLLIVGNTARGRKLNLHARWLETRRTAEYLRHSPILAATGVGRARGAWPQGVSSKWPEQYVRNIARAVGLPQARVDNAYLRAAITALRDHHVVPQRDYHAQKSAYLNRIHHGLDHLSERLFMGAILTVSLFLILTVARGLGWIDPVALSGLAKWFTVLAVALPTLGGSFAGIRYFGDFERFAEISQVTSKKLDSVAHRIEVLLACSDDAITYDKVADIVRASDQIVFDEIQNWQAVFRTKIIAVPA